MLGLVSTVLAAAVTSLLAWAVIVWMRRPRADHSAALTPSRQWVERKLALAQELGAGGCGGDYADACLTLSAIVSAISADLWPGTGKDRVRFIEAWARYASSANDPRLISIPLLRAWLLKARKTNEVAEIDKARPQMFGAGHDARVLVGTEVDMTEHDVQRTCPSLTTAEIRAWSYPAVFYEHVRSNLVHEYHFGTTGSGWPMTERVDAAVSYVNHQGHRRIHFHLPWLVEVVRSIAMAAESDVANSPLAVPATWWGARG